MLVVAGEIDLAVAGRFAQELETLVDDAGGSGLVDLSGVGFIDSSGIRELLKAKRAAQAAGGELLLVEPLRRVPAGARGQRSVGPVHGPRGPAVASPGSGRERHRGGGTDTGRGEVRPAARGGGASSCYPLATTAVNIEADRAHDAWRWELGA